MKNKVLTFSSCYHDELANCINSYADTHNLNPIQISVYQVDRLYVALVLFETMSIE